MPSYEWVCGQCERKTEIVTRVDDRDQPPRACFCGAVDRWVRVPTVSTFQRGESWGSGKKGSWMWALLCFGLLGCEGESASAWFLRARLNPDVKVCGTVMQPEHLKGRYCIQYEGVTE